MVTLFFTVGVNVPDDDEDLWERIRAEARALDVETQGCFMERYSKEQALSVVVNLSEDAGLGAIQRFIPDAVVYIETPASPASDWIAVE